MGRFAGIPAGLPRSNLFANKKMRKPKHRQIFEYVHQSIVDGQYSAGQRLPTDGQLMRRFETSRPTVARAMRDLEQAGFVERRPGSGSYVRVRSEVKTSVSETQTGAFFRSQLGGLAACLVFGKP